MTLILLYLFGALGVSFLCSVLEAVLLSTPISFISMKESQHISVITDEYGCMRGIVTMEDVIETMLGVEIVDECDTTDNLQAMARKKFTPVAAQ